MHPLKTFVTAAAFTAGLAAQAAPAVADSSSLVGVKSMDVMLSGATPSLTVRNNAANHHLGSLKLAVQENQIAVSVGGYVECLGTTSENLAWRHGTFLRDGAFGIGRTNLLLSRQLPQSSSIDHVSDMDAHSFQLPTALLANPQIAVDPVAVVLAAADKAPDRLQYLRQNHVIKVQLPIRWQSTCAAYSRDKIGKNTIVEAMQPLSYVTKNVELKIDYRGDPQLFEVNAQLSQGGGLPNQLQAGPQPLEITSMQFQPNMPHHVGACPATTKIRVFYQGQGKGEIRIRINAGNTPKHESAVIPFDSQNGMQHYDFELETPKAYKNNINNTVMHNLRVYVRGKSAAEQVWPTNYQLMDSAVWKTRCTPQVNPVVGGNAGGKVGGYQNGTAGAKPAPTLQLQQPQPTPTTRIIRRAQ